MSGITTSEWTAAAIPTGCAGIEIPLLAQIVTVVDTYDAITTDRPYRPARPAEVAYAELTGEVAHGWRDRDLVETFIALGRRGGLATASVAVA